MVERIPGFPRTFLKAADLYTSIRKDGDMKKAGNDYLRRRMDAAYFWHANLRTAAMVALLLATWAGRRWRQRLAGQTRTFRAHGYGGYLRHLPGYLKVPTR